jgi:hypothetical protein
MILEFLFIWIILIVVPLFVGRWLLLKHKAGPYIVAISMTTYVIIIVFILQYYNFRIK